MDFQNPFTPNFAQEVRSLSAHGANATICIGEPQQQQEKKSDALVFSNSLALDEREITQSPPPLSFSPRLKWSERSFDETSFQSNAFRSSFSPRLPGEDYQYIYPHDRKIPKVHDHIYVEDKTKHEPLTLILHRRTTTNYTQLCSPIDYSTVYTVQETCRGFWSPEPDLKIFRSTGTNSGFASGDELIGTVRYGFRFSNSTVTPAPSGRSYSNIDHFRPLSLAPEHSSRCTGGSNNGLTWRSSPRSRQRRPRIRITRDGSVQLIVTQPIVKLDLVDPHDNVSRKPLCTVSMFTARPLGIIEIFAPGADLTKDHLSEDGREHWAAMDELVLSAYANLEHHRRRTMIGGEIVSRSDAMVGGIMCIIGVGVYLVWVWTVCGTCFERDGFSETLR